jgi:hypothetical protein
MKRPSMFLLALVVPAPALAVASAQSPILLRAKGPVAAMLATGKPLPADSKIALQTGDVLMLLDVKGVRTLTGPGYLHNGVFTRTGRAVSGAGARVAAVRGGWEPDVSTAPTPHAQTWVVPLSDMGAVCLPNGLGLSLWTPNSTNTSLQVQQVGSDHSRRLTWPARSERINWPRDLPTAPGTRYRVTIASGEPSAVEFRLSAEDPLCASQIDLNLQLMIEGEEQMLNEYLN